MRLAILNFALQPDKNLILIRNIVLPIITHTFFVRANYAISINYPINSR